MTNGCVAQVRIVGDDDIAVFDLALVGFQKTVNEGAKLANHHFPFSIGNHWKAVALLTNAGAHRRTKQHSIHLFASIRQSIFNDVYGNRVNLNLIEWRRIRFE